MHYIIRFYFGIYKYFFVNEEIDFIHSPVCGDIIYLQNDELRIFKVVKIRNVLIKFQFGVGTTTHITTKYRKLVYLEILTDSDISKSDLYDLLCNDSRYIKIKSYKHLFGLLEKY